MTTFAYLFIAAAAVFVVIIFVQFMRFQNNSAATVQPRKKKRP